MFKVLLLSSLVFGSASALGMDYFYSLFPSTKPTQTIEFFEPTRMSRLETIKPKVAMINLFGQIDFQKIMLEIIGAGKDPEIHGMLLIIDNYGGSIPVFSAVHDLIKRVGKIKPVVALVVGSAHSCGYMITSAAHYVIAHSCSEVGNIGAYYSVAKYRDTKKTGEIEANVAIELFQAGEFKTIFNEHGKDLSESDRNYINEIVSKTYQQFLKMVASNRSLDLGEYKIWAEGKTFIAHDALELGLIDEIGTLFEAEEMILKLIREKNPDYQFEDAIIPVFTKQ